MLNSGDVVLARLGAPTGREAGFRHPAIVVTAQAILDGSPSVVHVDEPPPGRDDGRSEHRPHPGTRGVRSEPFEAQRAGVDAGDRASVICSATRRPISGPCIMP